MGLRNGKAIPPTPVRDHFLLNTDQYHDTPTVSLEQAVKPLLTILPAIETYVEMVKEKCRHPADGLTVDESASIMLYSIKWQPLNECLYTVLNSILSCSDDCSAHPWLLYLKLLFTALLHLPSHQSTVYRGCKSDQSAQYQLNELICWKDLPLCTTSIEHLQSGACLGRTGSRTILKIECNTARNICQHCYSASDALALVLPATQFKVIEFSHDRDNQLQVITLQEMDPAPVLHSADQTVLHRNAETSSSLFASCWPSLRKSGQRSFVSDDHYRNVPLEHRIMQCEHAWMMDLDKQSLTDRDMKTVVKYALIKHRCKRLRLRDNRITCHGASMLAEGLDNNTTLETLDLRNNEIADLGVQYLASAIRTSNIRTLNLESNQITAEGAQYLAHMVRDNQNLTELYLSKNHLGDQGVQLIANALSDNTHTVCGQAHRQVCARHPSTLQHLYLGHNDITDEGVTHLSNMLRSNRTLTWLWLTGNEISNRGVDTLSHVLADYNTTIEWLFLNSNRLINDESVDALLNMFRRNNTLKTLYINNCSLSDVAQRQLLKTVKTKKDFDLEV